MSNLKGCDEREGEFGGESLVRVLSLSMCSKGALGKKDIFNSFQEIPKPGKIMLQYPGMGTKGKKETHLLTTIVSKALKCGVPILSPFIYSMNI